MISRPGVGAGEQQQVGDQPAHALEERRAEAAASCCSPSQRLLEQLEVGEHRRQRRAQLVRGVGDELALARERGLGLGAGVVERVQHRLQRRRRARRPRRRRPGAASAASRRACARSRARSRSARRSAPSRGARWPGRRAARARRRRARRGRGTASRGWRWPGRRTCGAPYWVEDRRRSGCGTRVEELQLARLDPPAVDHLRPVGRAARSSARAWSRRTSGRCRRRRGSRRCRTAPSASRSILRVELAGRRPICFGRLVGVDELLLQPVGRRWRPGG